MKSIREYVERICDGQSLSMDESFGLFSSMVAGDLDPVEISAVLVALKAKGEEPEEIAGAAKALRESAAFFPRPDYECADSCGTGGDGTNTFNISTAVAVVAAEAGIPVVKHGNRSVSSNCGSADLLEKAGVNIHASPDAARRCLDEAGLCFLFAPQYHSGLRFAMPVRRRLRTRTIMNILGPLVNPALPDYQLMGVYDPDACSRMAVTLGMLGAKAAIVVNGSGLDEVAVHDVTRAAVYRNGSVSEITISPSDAGLETFAIEDLTGGDPDENTRAFISLLKGQGDEAHAAAVALNAGVLAWICSKADDLKKGTQNALDVIKSGRCYERLQLLVEISNGS